MFQTKNVNYKMLSNDSLDAVRQFVLTESKIYGVGLHYSSHKPINRSLIWKPYTNLLKPITNYFKEKDLSITALVPMRIEANTKNTPYKRANSVNGTNTMVLIPLFDYSRTQKILHFRSDKFALNSSLVFDHSLYRQEVNEYNTKFCFLIYGLNDNIDIVKERLSS